MVIGYTQGTFDMFHIGHLNLLRRASEMCDHLIVGVNSDELVKNYKQHIPVIPQEERMAIIAAIRYADEVVLTESLDKVEALNKYHFQKIFIGDDWKGNARWEQTKIDMEQLGVEFVWVPYTKHISSSMLREKVNK